MDVKIQEIPKTQLGIIYFGLKLKYGIEICFGILVDHLTSDPEV